MSLYLLLTIAHVVGAAVGVGAATASDTTFMRAIRNRSVSRDQLVIIRSVSRVVLFGLALVLLTGVGLLVHNPSILQQEFFQAKMVAAFILVLNGFVFHTFIERFLEEHVERELTQELLGHRIWVFAVAGTVSIVSWYAPLLLILVGRTGFGFWINVGIYAAVVVVGVVVAYLLLTHSIIAPRQEPQVDDVRKRRDHTGSRWTVAMLVILLIAFVVTVVLSLGRVGTVHIVRIDETPPFWDPVVLRVEPGEQIVFTHAPSFPAPSTHPVHFISGPEQPSSNMRPVGRDEDGWSWSVVFNKPGIYEYVCPTHPYMRGIIAVGIDPHEDIPWPPDEMIAPELEVLPEVPGVGEIWVNTQFEPVEGRNPGTMTIIDAATWEIDEVISDPTFNNPHNFRATYDGRYVFQTQWHSDYINKIEVATREVVASKRITGAPLLSGLIERLAWPVGTAPAHVWVDAHRERVYLTLNNDGRVFVLDHDLNILKTIDTSLGPHGVWGDPSGRWLVVAATLGEKFDIIDLERDRVARTYDAPGLPLAAETTLDGRYAMISLLLENTVRVVNLETLEHERDIAVGALPIWPRAAPDGEHVFVPNTGSADVSVINLDSWEVVATLPAGNGAHGITFCPNAEGGYYGYVSNKYAATVTIIDPQSMETVGNIRLPEGAYGGQGIHCFPDNPWDAQGAEAAEG